VTEPCDSAAAPYRLCTACHARLNSRSLRPREWYNLAKRFGWGQYLLHDDFYDDDGEAMQPKEGVENPTAFPIPSIAEVTGTAELLLDYSITRWRLSDEIVIAWRRLESRLVLEALERRFRLAVNEGVRSVILELAAIVLKDAAADLVRSAWDRYPREVGLHSLIRASASCLPFAEAFASAISALEALPLRKQRDAMLSLSYFQSPAVLDWIETQACEPTTGAWGNLAAASGFSWSRAMKWLRLGRPCSLVAIDALCAIANPRTPLLRSIQPILLEAPCAAELRNALFDYAKTDDVPRVRQGIESVLRPILNTTKVTASSAPQISDNCE
jgi:hypothetical protein